mmetsp:Transcript_68050/g.153971  ORF Transcript_68050/g.153971 Transcript_68050/m.153971 type:complete len:105 (-) Transcript_68050:141-455(-)
MIRKLPLRQFEELLRTNPTADDSCPICLCDYADEDALRVLPCSHHFHDKCARSWLEKSKTCPLCRAELPPLESDPVLGASSVASSEDESFDRGSSSHAPVLLSP